MCQARSLLIPGQPLTTVLPLHTSQWDRSGMHPQGASMDICQCDDVELGNKRAERRGEQKAILGDGVRTQFVAGRWLTPSSAAGGGGFGGCGGLGGDQGAQGALVGIVWEGADTPG